MKSIVKTYDRGPQEAGALATCPACLGTYKLNTKGRMYRHGWNAFNISHGGMGEGWHTSPCEGFQKQPLEQTDEDGIKAAKSWRNQAHALDAAREKHENNPYPSYAHEIRHYIGIDGVEKAEEKLREFLSEIPGAEPGPCLQRRYRLHMRIQVSRDYDPKAHYHQRLGKFPDYDTLRQRLIKDCKANAEQCRKHADKIEKACQWHAENDITPLEAKS